MSPPHKETYKNYYLFCIEVSGGGISYFPNFLLCLSLSMGIYFQKGLLSSQVTFPTFYFVLVNSRGAYYYNITVLMSMGSNYHREREREREI